MAIGSTALFNLIIILIIGAVAGLAFNRYAHSWLARLGSTTRSDITAALVPFGSGGDAEVARSHRTASNVAEMAAMSRTSRSAITIPTVRSDSEATSAH
jgi:hypothetical protein